MYPGPSHIRVWYVGFRIWPTFDSATITPAVRLFLNVIWISARAHLVTKTRKERQFPQRSNLLSSSAGIRPAFCGGFSIPTISMTLSSLLVSPIYQLHAFERADLSIAADLGLFFSFLFYSWPFSFVSTIKTRSWEILDVSWPLTCEGWSRERDSLDVERKKKGEKRKEMLSHLCWNEESVGRTKIRDFSGPQRLHTQGPHSTFDRPFFPPNKNNNDGAFFLCPAQSLRYRGKTCFHRYAF